MVAIPFFDPDRDSIPAPLNLSKGVMEDGTLPGHEGNLDPRDAGENWSTNEIEEEGIPKHYVLPTYPDDRPPSGDGIFLGDAGERYKKTGEYYRAFDSDEAAERYMHNLTLPEFEHDPIETPPSFDSSKPSHSLPLVMKPNDTSFSRQQITPKEQEALGSGIINQPDEPITEEEAPRELPKTGVMPGVLHLNDKIAPKVPKGAPRPLAPGEWIDNPDGSWSSEISNTVQAGVDPRLNHGRATIIPGMWIVDGKPVHVDEDTAIEYALQSGLPFKSYNSNEEAEKASQDREDKWQTIEPKDAGKVAPFWMYPAPVADKAGTVAGDAPPFDFNKPHEKLILESSKTPTLKGGF